MVWNLTYPLDNKFARNFVTIAFFFVIIPLFLVMFFRSSVWEWSILCFKGLLLYGLHCPGYSWTKAHVPGPSCGGFLHPRSQGAPCAATTVCSITRGAFRFGRRQHIKSKRVCGVSWFSVLPGISHNLENLTNKCTTWIQSHLRLSRDWKAVVWHHRFWLPLLNILPILAKSHIKTCIWKQGFCFD